MGGFGARGGRSVIRSPKPAPSGSATAANTIGRVRLICCNAVTARVPLAKMMSGASATNSGQTGYAKLRPQSKSVLAASTLNSS